MFDLLLAELAGEHSADHLTVTVLLLVLVPGHLMDILNVSGEVSNAVVFVTADLAHVNTAIQLGLH